MRKLIYICVLILIVSNSVYPGIGDWTTYTNMNYVNRLLLTENFLWMATTGGLLKFSLIEYNYQKITNVDGLGGNYLYSIASDTTDNLWLGAKNGILTRFEPENNLFRVYLDLIGHGIKIIAPDRDKLWIGSDIGISLFLIYKNEGEIKETYRHLGNLEQEIGVNSISLSSSRIWVGTEKGIAFAPKDDPNLLDPSHWYSFVSGQNGLTCDSVLSILNVGEELYIGTKEGVFGFNASDSSWSFLGLDGLNARDLIYDSGKILAATNWGVFVYEGGTWVQVNLNGLKNYNLNSIEIDSSGRLWVGTEGSGISVYENSSWTNFQIDGPPGNIFNKIAIEESGRIWCSNWNAGCSSFNGTSWRSFQDTLYSLFSRRPVIASVALDYESNVWFGSWGDGLYKLDSQGNWSMYDSSNSELRPYSGHPLNTVVSDVIIDEAGTKWMANWEGVEGRTVVAFQDNQWMPYLNLDGIKSNLINSIYAEGGHLWICHRGSGLGYLDYKWTPLDKSDDFLEYFNKSDDYLSGDDIRCARVDRRGNLWVGTNEGLDRYDLDINRFTGVQLPEPLGPQINCITVDEMNNKWIGTINGVGVINDQDSFVYVFTTTNSSLVDNEIWFINVDNKKGIAWIGTENGLSAYQYKTSAENLCEVYPYPNPAVVSNGEEKVTFDVSVETRVRIFTVAGDWVAEAKPGVIGKIWDLRNRAGELVASGIYLFLIYDQGGESCVGKIVVIRE